MEKWVIAAKRADFNQIGQQFHIDPVIARLIRNRDVIGEDKIREYLSGTVQELPSPWLMKDMEKAVDILEKKISQKAKVRIIVDYEGRIDLTEHTLGRLECIVASFHEQTFKAGTVEQHTNAYMQALKNPKIHILGHSGTAQYPYDHDTVIKEAARLGKAIELNEATFHVRPSSIANCRKIIAKCKKYGIMMALEKLVQAGIVTL